MGCTVQDKPWEVLEVVVVVLDTWMGCIAVVVVVVAAVEKGMHVD